MNFATLLVLTALLSAAFPFRYAHAAVTDAYTDDVIHEGPRRPSMHYAGLRDGDFFDSLDVLNAPLLRRVDPVSRLHTTLFESRSTAPGSAAQPEPPQKEPAHIYSSLNNTQTTITTLSMNAVHMMDGSSSCSASLGCPRSSVAWASGTFTFTELITPASLSTDANLSLKISLCCDYKFHGALLRDSGRYNQFLSFLLQASPFQVLSPAAKAQLFPQTKAFIVNSKTGQAYDHRYTLTEADVQHGNDGDGDVIVLFTGRVEAAELAKVAFSSLRSPTATADPTGSRGDDADMVTSAREDASADMQLKIVNTVLKCKCPHTLLVMPLLRMQRDTLPPISILGLGPHCGVVPQQTPVTPHRYITRVLRDGVTRSRVEEAVSHLRDVYANATSSSPAAAEPARALDELVGYATSFVVSPPVLPASEVHWCIREDVPHGRVVLDHRRVLVAEVDSTGALLLDHAASPYWIVDPDVRYLVEVTVSRQGVRQSARGMFTLRLPFNRPWALPPVRPKPHFGFTRQLRLDDEETLSHAEVAHALDPHTTPPSSRAIALASARGSARGPARRPLFYRGYWENTPLQDQLVPQKSVRVPHNPYDDSAAEAAFPLFIGKNILAYFVRDVDDVCDPVPLEGRELWAVQGIITTPSPATACAETHEMDALILRQLLWRMRRERRFLVNLPSSSWARASPEPEEGKEGEFRCHHWGTAARDVLSEAATSVCQATLALRGGISGTAASLRLPYRDVYRVVWAADLVVDNVSSATAMLVPENIDREYVTVHVVNTTHAGDEGQSSPHAVVRIEVRSRPHLVVRRIATYPSSVVVELPMHERRWRVSPPRPLASSLTSLPAREDGSGDGHDARHHPYRPRESFSAEDETPSGYWLARNPLALRSVNEHLEALLDTRDVPNVQRMLPNGTLVFVAQDAGEDLSTVYGVTYLARCPDVPVEVLVSVVAIKAPPIVPAYVPVYTEEGCVEVRPPRALRKDEVLEWRVPACPQAAHPPFLVQREVSYDEAALEAAAERRRARLALQAEKARRAKRGLRRGWLAREENDDDDDDDDVKRDALSRVDSEQDVYFDDDDVLPGVPVPGTGGRRRVVMLACGVEVYSPCEVTWTATNLVGLVSKTYSLHRCQSPPDVVFHVDGLQQDRGLPSRYFELPSIVERVQDAVAVVPSTRADTSSSSHGGSSGSRVQTEGPFHRYTTYSAATGTWETHSRIMRDDEYLPYTVPDGEADQLRHVLHETPHFLSRTVIPIAGYDADVGYSFNFTGPQSYFEAEMTPLIGFAANELLQTRAYFTYPYTLTNGELEKDMDAMARRRRLTESDIPLLVWRRLSRLEAALAAEEAAAPLHRRNRQNQGDHADDDGWGTIYDDDPFYPHNAHDMPSDDDEAYEDDSAEDWQHVSRRHSADDDEAFWADLYSGRQPHATGDDASGRRGRGGGMQSVRSPAEVYFRRLQREAQRRTRAEDARLNRLFLLRHHVDRRRLELHRLHNASLYPMDYTIRASRIAPNAAAEADRAEFAKRGMCLARTGHTSVLVVNPRGAVLEDERYGTLLPPPPPPAVAVLPFCQEQYTFSRHPHLDVIYRYDFTWECEDTAIMVPAKRDAVYSTITHIEAPARNGSRAMHRNATNCRLVVHNHLTQTTRADWFLVQRVFPTRLTSTDFVVLGDGAASSVLVRVPSSSPSTRAAPRYHSSVVQDKKGAADAYVRRPSGYEGRPRRVVGPSAVVHVDAPSNPNTARWSLRTFIPQLSSPSGTEMAVAQVHFTSLFKLPAAVARGRGGSTALVKGLREPGLYTIGHDLPDPGYPLVCPNVSVVETLDVFRAQVLERELFICGGTATLRAVPIPHDISHEFIGQWEVVALETADKEVWTRGINFTGIRFDHGSRETTLVHGLPFGILTIRWAIYRVYTEDDNDIDGEGAAAFDPDRVLDEETKLFSRGEADTGVPYRRPASGRGARERRVLVDYDSVRVIVLTENLFSHRLVTLASAADVVTTSSTVDWYVRETDENGKPILDSATNRKSSQKKAMRDAFGRSQHDTLDPRLGWQPLLNFSGYYPVDEPVMFPYVGAHPPRPGSGLLSMSDVPVGTTELMYTLRPSENVFGPMLGQTCELRGTFLIERVSAYFTVNTTLDHECDSYTGRAKVSMCLHAEVPAAFASTSPSHKRKSSRAWRSTTTTGAKTRTQQAWAANVQLVPLDTFEAVLKDGARQVEASGCSTPWWVWPETHWTDLTPIRREGLPHGRCVRFTVRADRHLSPREVALPLFLATPGSGASTAPSGSGARQPYGRSVALVDANGIVIADSGDSASVGSVSRGPHTSGSTSRGHRVCAATPDFITSRVIEGAGHVGLEETSASAAAGKGSDRGLAGSFIFSRQQKHRRGTLAYLPILDTRTLYRRDVAMRPLVGQQGLPDETTTELNVTRGNESVVTLRLDLAEPRLLGGYVAFHDPTAAPIVATDAHDGHTADGIDMPDSTRRRHADVHRSATPRTTTQTNTTVPPSSTSPPPPLSPRTRRQSLLLQCVDGHVRASDVLQFWTETNRPDGAVGRTAEEWLEYVHATQDMPVPCEVLFPSLDYILSSTEVIDRTGKARVVASSTTSDAKAALGSGAGVATEGPRHGGLLSSSSATSGRSTPSGGRSHPHAQLVSAEVITLQLDRIQRAFRVTQDGIDVTGLRPDLQLALARRRLTPQQLRELEQARQTLQQEEKARAAKQRLELMTAPSLMTHTERMLQLIETYHKVTGLEPNAIRLRLPRYEAFSTPYDLLLRTALHKDVICGTHIDYPPLIPAGQPTPLPNRHALVTMGRVEIVDVPPLLTPPGPIKQCEVEGDVPVLLVNISGAVFSEAYFTADRVELRELENPNLPPNRSPDVGLTPCLGALRNGMHAVVGRATQKALFLQLSACPQFQMLSSDEYNEYQDSDELLRRLQHPRFLQVRIRDALRADSFTARGRDARDVTFVVEVRPTLARLHLHAAELAEQPHQSHRHTGSASRPSTTASILRSTLPWGGGSRGAKTYEQRRSGPFFQATSQRPLLMCESDLRQYGFELGVELIGDTWTRPVGADGEYAAQQDAAAGEQVWQQSQQQQQKPMYQTIRARGGLDEPTRRRAPQNTALINSFSIVEHYSLDSTHHLYLKGGGVYRSHFVNYLFSTILSDRDTLLYHEFVRRYNDTFVSLEVPPQPESAGAGLDRLQVWGDAVNAYGGVAFDGVDEGEGGDNGAAYTRGRGRYDGTRDDLRAQRAWRELPAVRRFSKVEEILFAVPGIATKCHGCLLADTTFFVAGDLTGLWAFLDASGGADVAGGRSLRTGHRGTPQLSPHHLTAKELPTYGTPALESAFLSRPLIIPWDSVAHIPQQWHLMWLCPASAYRALHRFQQYWRSPIIPSAAAGEGGAYVEASVVVYALRDALGAELAPAHRPTTLLTSEPISLARVLAQSQPRQPLATEVHTSQTGVLATNVRFTMNASSISAAYTAIAADLIRYRRSHVLASHTFDFHRDGLYTNGALAVNASVFVKLCVPLPPSAADGADRTDAAARGRRPAADGTEEVRAHPVASTNGAEAASTAPDPQRQCMIVSITDTLLTVEAPVTAGRHTRSWLRRLLALGQSRTGSADRASTPRYASPLKNGEDSVVEGRGVWTLASVLHHVCLALLVYLLIPNLGLVESEAAQYRRKVRGAESSRSDASSLSSHTRDYGASPTRVGLSVMVFVCLMLVYAQSPTKLWVVCWLAIWTVTLYVFKSAEAVVSFVVSAVFWRLTLEMQ